MSKKNRAASDKRERYASCRRIAEKIQNHAVAAFVNADCSRHEAESQIDNFG